MREPKLRWAPIALLSPGRLLLLRVKTLTYGRLQLSSSRSSCDVLISADTRAKDDFELYRIAAYASRIAPGHARGRNALWQLASISGMHRDQLVVLPFIRLLWMVSIEQSVALGLFFAYVSTCNQDGPTPHYACKGQRCWLYRGSLDCA